MFDLDKALAAWRRTLEHNRAFTADDIDELERHIRDEVHAQMVRGIDEETAYRQALRHFGAYGEVETAYRQVYWGKAWRQRRVMQALGGRVQMWKTYFKLAYRNLLRDKLSAGINIVGFATAISCCILVFVYLHQQANLDTFHADVDRIFQVQQTFAEPTRGKLRLGPTPMPLGAMLATDMPQVEVAVRVQRGRASVRVDGSVFDESLLFVDPGFLHLFTFPLQYGSKDALADPQQIVLSQALAEKYFGGANPVGQTVTLTFEEQYAAEFVVGGVAAPFPNNRAFAFSLLVPFQQQRRLGLENLDDWGRLTNATFIRVRSTDDLPGLAVQLVPYIDLWHATLDEAQQRDMAMSGFAFENLPDIGKNEEEVMNALIGGSSLAENIFMIVIALIILLLASTNYVNIAIVSASRRIKEIGIRKVVGGNRGQLVIQFLTENLVLCFLALLGGVALAYYVLLPGFNSLFPPHAPVFEMDLTGNWMLWLFLLLLLFFVAILSGAYPALYIARFEPVVIFRGRQQFGGRNRFIQGLLVFQFAFTFIALILPIANKQHYHVLASRDWGYEAEHVVVAPLHNTTTYTVLHNALSQMPDVEVVTGARYHIGARQGAADIRIDGVEHRLFFYDVGEDYAAAMGLRLQQGRFLTRRGEAAILVNEAFVAKMGWTEALGKEVVLGEQTYEIVGVVGNFLRRRWADAEPHFLRMTAPDAFRYLVVKTRPGATGRVARTLEDQWTALNPSVAYAGFYQADVFDDADADPFGFIAFLTLLLSCTGNLGLVALHVARRRKEISIRKVMGASPLRIIYLVLASFFKQATLAFIIAIPVAYLMLRNLMDERVATFDMGVMPFLFTAGLMLGTLFLTLSTQLFKAVSTNPVDNLRAE